MTKRSSLIFLVDLVQDIAAYRSVAIFAKQATSCDIVFIVSGDFGKRDASGLWAAELRELSATLDGSILDAPDVVACLMLLDGHTGILLSACESYLNNHKFCRDVFAGAPPDLVRLTLQHGFECIGFNHNEAHDRFHGSYVGLGCDVAACWFEADQLYSVRPDQRAKIMLVGPPIGLEKPFAGVVPNAPRRSLPAPPYGLVCENLHSVRFRAVGVAASFLATFATFADRFAAVDGEIELRPHPAGRYTDRQGTPLPTNARVNTLPLYRQSLRKFGFCISAPSSILFDMVWAGVPVAVWTDGDETLDIGMYKRLTVVRDADEWFEFAVDACKNPLPYLQAQADYVAGLRLPVDIPARYRDLLAIAL